MSTYNTYIGEFCATHHDWETLLSQEPYSLLIKREDGFIIFNYRQLESDFNNKIVREARGIIFKEGEWEYPVCHAFDKFGNYGESYVPDMDWSSIVVSEKIDGSIMKLWHYDGVWHLSTNGNIHASNARIDDIRRENFQQVFWEAVTPYLVSYYDGAENIPEWFNELDTDFTYIFELVSPYNRVVIPYETINVYFLGARNNRTNHQVGCDVKSALNMNVAMFPRPTRYPMTTYDEIVKAAMELPWSKEGYVCYDKYFNRCKIKSPRYVVAHFARNNNVITRKHLIDIILKGEMNEFLIYASDYKERMMWVKDLMDDFIKVINGAAYVGKLFRKFDRPKAAEIIKNFDKFAQPIMFFNYERDMSAEDYVKDWDANKWDRILTQYEKFKERYR